MILGSILGGPAKFMESVDFHSAASNEKHAAFTEFLAIYGRSYASKSEINDRFGVFSANFDEIKAHNSRPESGFEMGIN